MLIDRQLGADLSNIAAAYRKYTPGASFGLSEISPTVREMILKIKTAARRGAVAADGTLYNDIYKKLGEEIADPATSAASKKALGEIQDALSEAMRRGIQASGGGRKAEALLDELRGSFQKYMAVRNASVSKIDGKYFDPAALLSAVKTIDDDALKFGTGRLANMANLSKAADTVGFALKEAPKDQRFALRYTVPGLAGMAAPSLFGVTGTLAAPAAGLAGLLGYGTARLGEKAFRGAEAGLAASKLGQSVLSNQAGPGITSLVRGTGEGISAAAPYAGQAISDTFGLGNLSEASLPF
jgi:hypothetical protein